MKHRERQPDAFEAALLEERPEIPPDFAAKLDAWAAEGFPPAEGAGSGGSAWERLRKRLSVVGPSGVLAPAGMVAVALVALVVGINALSDTGGQTGTDSLSGSPDPDRLESTGGAAREPAPAQDSIGISPDDPTAVPPIDDFSKQRIEQIKPGEDRIQEKSVTTTLSTEPDEVDDVSDGVVEVAERYDGIVVSSNVNTTGDRGARSSPCASRPRTCRPSRPTSPTSRASRPATRAPSTSPRPSSAPRSVSTTPRPRSTPWSSSSPRPAPPTKSPTSSCASRAPAQPSPPSAPSSPS